ncbi:DRAP deaminase [Basidiobolus ranarum]|uniref:Pseudouridine synthase n=1 Tax=Basidiobolus ranarum TaxID=34480 RepID=A0ABR2WAT6_9FUNG
MSLFQSSLYERLLTIYASNLKVRFLSYERSAGHRLRRKDLRDPEQNVKYILENGLRKVEPYFFTHKTFTKERWLNRPLISVLQTEFKDRPPDYYQKAILEGWVTVNEKKVSSEYLLMPQDVLAHTLHRHEPPVTGENIKIIHEDEEILVVDKPASIPVHPTGRYQHNTVLNILKYEHGYQSLFPVNRLDRLTSGILIFARTKESAQLVERAMRERLVQKEYVCRVLGEFPSEIVCNEKLLTVSHRLGLNVVSPDGKESTTIFKRLSFDGETSIVQCKPITGRTHQIRVHLQYLGHPIANDPIYASPEAWGPTRGKGKIYDAAEHEATIHDLATQEFVSKPNSSSTSEEQSTLTRPLCEICNIPTYYDPHPGQLSIWLHAMKYTIEGYTFQTDLPSWANEDYLPDTYRHLIQS